MDYMDHFGENSEKYLQFRPAYPEHLYDFLLSLVRERKLAWDCGTGNGQAAAILANYFQEVVASDISKEQLSVAIKKSNIHYHAWSAEKTELPDASVDLITVAQALHWFNFDAFYAEVNRVAKTHAIIAAWCYAMIDVDKPTNKIIKKLYNDILGNQYWPKERKYIDMEYATIPFPFNKINVPHFKIEKDINFEQLLGYLNTWSAVKEYAKCNEKNPITFIYTELKEAWGSEDVKQVSWPIYLLVGQLSPL